MNASQIEQARVFKNVLQSTQIATIVVDEHHQICSFTPAVKEIYGLIDSDVGRPLSQFMPMVEQMPPLPALHELCPERPIEHLLGGPAGKAFLRRVLPFTSDDGEFKGIVITFVDVTILQVRQAELLESQKELKQQTRRLRTITDATPTMIAYVNADLRV